MVIFHISFNPNNFNGSSTSFKKMEKYVLLYLSQQRNGHWFPLHLRAALHASVWRLPFKCCLHVSSDIPIGCLLEGTWRGDQES